MSERFSTTQRDRIHTSVGTRPFQDETWAGGRLRPEGWAPACQTQRRKSERSFRKGVGSSWWMSTPVLSQAPRPGGWAMTLCTEALSVRTCACESKTARDAVTRFILQYQFSPSLSIIPKFCLRYKPAQKKNYTYFPWTWGGSWDTSRIGVHSYLEMSLKVRNTPSPPSLF